MSSFVKTFGNKFMLGTFASGLGVIKLNGMATKQIDNYSVRMHANDKLLALERFPLVHSRRRQLESPLTKNELSSFIFLNHSLRGFVLLHLLFVRFTSHVFDKNSLLRVSNHLWIKQNIFIFSSFTVIYFNLHEIPSMLCTKSQG